MCNKFAESCTTPAAGAGSCPNQFVILCRVPSPQKPRTTNTTLTTWSAGAKHTATAAQLLTLSQTAR